MASIWILHRDERLRAALARLAGVRDDALVASPDDLSLPGAGAPAVVVLGLAGDLEVELELAHRTRGFAGGAHWIVVCDREQREEVAALFAPLPVDLVDFPPTSEELRERIRAARRARSADGLARRATRDALAARFGRWFADLEMPLVLRALDPALTDVPFVVRGEPGTGRGLLARYVHAFGGASERRWVELSCADAPDAFELLARLARGAGGPGAARGLAICLLEAHRLAPTAQQAVAGWVELGIPPEAGPLPRARWLATVDDAPDALALPLAQALAGLQVRIPPLRERPDAIGALAADAALAWARERGLRPRRLAPDATVLLRGQLWPGNLRELEAVVHRSLAIEPADPLHAAHLHFEAEPEAEPGAREVPAALRETPERRAAVEARPEPAEAPPAEGPDRPQAARRILRSLAHEIRNPLTTIRTFTQLLGERGGDAEFQREFGAVVGRDVDRIERAVERVAAFAELPPSPGGAVDVTALLEEQLEAVRSEIEERRLLVLKELEPTTPLRGVDRGALALAFELLLTQALAWMPDRADVYLAARQRDGGPGGAPSVRVMMRFYRPEGVARDVGRRAEDAAAEALSVRETSLELALAELLIEAQGGALTLETTLADETVVAVDLPGAV